MKRIIYLLVLSCPFLISSCEDLEVGYLVTDTAGYTIDSLHLFDVEKRLEDLTVTWDQFMDEAGPLMEEKAVWEKKRDEILVERDKVDDEMREVEQAIKLATDPTIIQGLENRLDELYDLEYELYMEWDDADYEVWMLNRSIEEIANDMGIESSTAFKNQIAKFQNRIKYDIPWVTSPMEKVLGTQPMVFSIADVKNENPENAKLFWESLTIMGGGRMYVDYDVKAPAGRYVVSVRIENEGQTRVLNDVFTFILGEE